MCCFYCVHDQPIYFIFLGSSLASFIIVNVESLCFWTVCWTKETVSRSHLWLWDYIFWHFKGLTIHQSWRQSAGLLIMKPCLEQRESRPSFPCSFISCTNWGGGRVQTPPVWCKLILGKVHSRSWETATVGKLGRTSMSSLSKSVARKRGSEPTIEAEVTTNCTSDPFIYETRTSVLLLDPLTIIWLADSHWSRGSAARRIHPPIAPFTAREHNKSSEGSLCFCVTQI